MKLEAIARWSLWLALCGSCGDDGRGPRLDELRPAAAGEGESIELRGARFCGGRADAAGRCDPLPPASVLFSLDPPQRRAEIVAYSDERIVLAVPDLDPGPTRVLVVVDGESSQALEFEVLP